MDSSLFVGWLASTAGGGERSSAATSYLASQFQARPNLHILLSTRVTRILQTTGAAGLTFRTVEFTAGLSTFCAPTVLLSANLMQFSQMPRALGP